MNDIPQTVEKTLEVLSGKFGTTVSHLWQVLVRQEIIDGIFGGVVVIGILLAIKPIIRLTKLMIQKEAEMAWIGYGIGLLFLILVFFSAMFEAVGALNPEYGALKTILFRSQP